MSREKTKDLQEKLDEATAMLRVARDELSSLSGPCADTYALMSARGTVKTLSRFLRELEDPR